MNNALQFLDFDYSEDTEGHGNFDAMASVAAGRVPYVRSEIDTVLAWAEATFPQARGALEEGATWDFDLQQQSEDGFEAFTLSLVGTEAFCEALRERFGLDED